MLRNRTLLEETAELKERVIRTELKELVCQSIEEVMNSLMDAEQSG